MNKLRGKGDLLHNTTDNITGEYIVARRPKKRSNRSVMDYTPSPKCKKSFLNQYYRHHFRRCIKLSGKGVRNLTELGRKIVPQCHSSANTAMKMSILPNMRNDDVYLVVRYDRLIVEYGNELCDGLRESIHHRANISTQLRRLGKLKLTMGIQELSSVISPNRSLEVIESIEIISGISEDKMHLAHPTVAANYGTIIKAVSKTLQILSIKDEN